jgi:hypothetical protein
MLLLRQHLTVHMAQRWVQQALPPLQLLLPPLQLLLSLTCCCHLLMMCVRQQTLAGWVLAGASA